MNVAKLLRICPASIPGVLGAGLLIFYSFDTDTYDKVEVVTVQDPRNDTPVDSRGYQCVTPDVYGVDADLLDHCGLLACEQLPISDTPLAAVPDFSEVAVLQATILADDFTEIDDSNLYIFDTFSIAGPGELAVACRGDLAVLYCGTFMVGGYGHFASIPEPSTFALLAAGAFGLLAFAWRRRRR